MPCAKEHIERDQSVAAVVHLEVLVVQVVDIGMAVERRTPANFELLEAEMPVDCTEAYRMQREVGTEMIRGNQQVQPCLGHVRKALPRMHRKRRPRRWIDRVVMDRMDPLVEQRRMDQSVQEE